MSLPIQLRTMLASDLSQDGEMFQAWADAVKLSPIAISTPLPAELETLYNGATVLPTWVAEENVSG